MGFRPRPLLSSRADDPAIAEAIDRFVVGLAPTVDDLQDAFSADDWPRLRRLCRALAVDADLLGYTPLAHLAAAVAECSACDKPDEARGVLIELTEVSLRIRMGHRGAI